MNRYAFVQIIDEKTPKWSAFCKRYLVHAAANKRPKSLITERSVLKTFTRFLNGDDPTIGAIDDARLDAWKADQVDAGYSANSIRLHLVIVRGVFSYAIKLGILFRNPFADVTLPKPQRMGRALTDQELGAFLDLLPKEDVRRACLFALYTGMRRSEVLELRWEEVFADRIELPASRAKNGKARIVYLHPKARACLGERVPGDKVFSSLRQSRLNYYVTKTWKRLGKGRIRFHDMRHIWATRFLEKTHDLPALMEVGGWSSASAAMVYQHPGERARKGVLKLRYAV